MKFLAVAVGLVGVSVALPQGSIEKDAEWTVSDLAVSSTPGVQGSLTTKYVPFFSSHCTFEVNAIGSLHSMTMPRCS
jgi:hypothetical protein